MRPESEKQPPARSLRPTRLHSLLCPRTPLAATSKSRARPAVSQSFGDCQAGPNRWWTGGI